ncbi:MAG: virulence RhuM family protein [Planctomycetaceae bacterium]|nr:virulence RhuM family protein [Planctomycetaceae bacterium]
MTSDGSPAIYVNPDGGAIEVPLIDGEFWATQERIADIFGTSRSNVSKHLKEIFESAELDEASNVKKVHIAINGATQPTKHYSLDAMISVGYRVGTVQGTKFRTWATGHLRTLATHGYAIETSNPEAINNLAISLRQIRTSEAEMFRRVKDIFKETAVDYDGNSQSARSFFAMATDKFLYAVTGKTAAQLIIERSDPSAPNAGMNSFRGDVPTLQDAKVGKNYLTAEELRELQILADQFMLFAESKAYRGHKMSMEEIQFKLNTMLQAFDYKILYEYGNYQRGEADAKAERSLKAYLKSLPKGDPQDNGES